eukprot:3212384-Pyramimonas_sp.AAC.1
MENGDLIGRSGWPRKRRELSAARCAGICRCGLDLEDGRGRWLARLWMPVFLVWVIRARCRSHTRSLSSPASSRTETCGSCATARWRRRSAPK